MANAVGENELPQIIVGEGASSCFSIGHGIGLSTAAGPRLLTAGSTSALFRQSDALAEKIGRPDLAEPLR
jgi:hypothetical protein